MVYFFKVVAWDESQNRRLYLLGQVDKLALERLLATLPAKERSTSREVLVPSWKFDDVNAQAAANSIVEEGRRSLATSSTLALGENLLDAFEVWVPTEAQLESARALAKARWPGSLSDWMAVPHNPKE